MLKKFKMEDCKPVSTPMITGCKLSKDDESLEVDQRLYRLMTGSLLYVTTSRPDVMEAIGEVARFQATPKETHVLVVERIFKYLKPFFALKKFSKEKNISPSMPRKVLGNHL